MIGTADLRSEHRAVSRMLDILDGVAASSRRGERLSTADLSQIVEFLHVFVDKCHHTKEEQLLFPAMRMAEVSGADGALGGLLADHVRGRDAAARLGSLVLLRDTAEESARTELADTIDDYTQLLRSHIVREENECFDPADRELPSAVQEQLADGYERIEREVVGDGVHEGFHALLERLSDSYHV